jgi:isoleucyl-tRNA synthetase
MWRRVYIVAADLAQSHRREMRLDRVPSSRLPRRAIEHAVFRHPFLERDSLGILADHVTLEQGTGAVHTAPGHGQEDYVIGRQYGIETYCPVDAAAASSTPKAPPGACPRN